MNKKNDIGRQIVDIGGQVHQEIVYCVPEIIYEARESELLTGFMKCMSVFLGVLGVLASWRE